MGDGGGTGPVNHPLDRSIQRKTEELVKMWSLIVISPPPTRGVLCAQAYFPLSEELEPIALERFPESGR